MALLPSADQTHRLVWPKCDVFFQSADQVVILVVELSIAYERLGAAGCDNRQKARPKLCAPEYRCAQGAFILDCIFSTLR